MVYRSSRETNDCKYDSRKIRGSHAAGVVGQLVV